MIKIRKERRLGFGIKVGSIFLFINSMPIELFYINYTSGDSAVGSIGNAFALLRLHSKAEDKYIIHQALKNALKEKK